MTKRLALGGNIGWAAAAYYYAIETTRTSVSDLIHQLDKLPPSVPGVVWTRMLRAFATAEDRGNSLRDSNGPLNLGSFCARQLAMLFSVASLFGGSVAYPLIDQYRPSENR